MKKQEFHNQYASPLTIRAIKSGRMRLAAHVARVGDIKKAYKILVGKPKKNMPVGKPMHKFEANVKLDLK
jgi:hypothetical protein